MCRVMVALPQDVDVDGDVAGVDVVEAEVEFEAAAADATQAKHQTVKSPNGQTSNGCQTTKHQTAAAASRCRYCCSDR